jgi:hypothetical protein
MKQSKTLTNEELGEKALEELEGPILKTCAELVETIDMQLRKKKYCLTALQQDALKEYIRNKVNLNVTINVGIGMDELDKADIFPTPLNQKKLDAFAEKKETAPAPKPEEAKTTLTKDHIEKLDKAAKALKDKAKEDEAFIEERRKRAAEVAQA